MIISATYYLVTISLGPLISILQGRPASRHVVLTYHSVGNEQSNQFMRQMAMVAKWGTPALASKISEKGGLHISVTFDDGFANVSYNALPYMAKWGIPATIFVTTGSLGRLPGWIDKKKNPVAEEQLMTKEQLRALDPRKITIGSHTVTHPHLAQLDDGAILNELIESKDELTRILGRRVSLLALPYGSFNKRVLELAEEAGYGLTFRNTPVLRSGNDSNHVVGRINVGCDDWPVEFFLKIHGAYGWLPFGMAGKKVLKDIMIGLSRRY